MYLLELRNERKTCGELDYARKLEVSDMKGYADEEPDLPHAVALKLSQCLEVNPASSGVFIRAGVFPAFELGIKDPFKPDVIVHVEDFIYEAWLTQQDIVVSRYPRNAECSSVSKVWGYFVHEHSGCNRRRRTNYDFEFDSSEVSAFSTSDFPWIASDGSKIEEHELSAVLIQYLCEISNAD